MINTATNIRKFDGTNWQELNGQKVYSGSSWATIDDKVYFSDGIDWYHYVSDVLTQNQIWYVDMFRSNTSFQFTIKCRIDLVTEAYTQVNNTEGAYTAVCVVTDPYTGNTLQTLNFGTINFEFVGGSGREGLGMFENGTPVTIALDSSLSSYSELNFNLTISAYTTVKLQDSAGVIHYGQFGQKKSTSQTYELTLPVRTAPSGDDFISQKMLITTT